MYETLIGNLTTVKMEYEKGLNITESIFNSLKINDIKALPLLTKAQTECMLNITKEKEKLRDTVKGISHKYNINSKEYRIQHILHLFKQNQKENIIDLSRTIYKLELSLQRTLYRNQDLLNSIISSTQTVVEAAIDYNENEYSESQLFLDEKF